MTAPDATPDEVLDEASGPEPPAVVRHIAAVLASKMGDSDTGYTEDGTWEVFTRADRPKRSATLLVTFTRIRRRWGVSRLDVSVNGETREFGAGEINEAIKQLTAADSEPAGTPAGTGTFTSTGKSRQNMRTRRATIIRT